MASRMIHLAVTELLLKDGDIPDGERFRLGSLLPDAYGKGVPPRVLTHFRSESPDGRFCFDLERFRTCYAEELGDPLYLGYYLHLLEDALFRRCFLENIPDWRGEDPVKVERLHRDYWYMNRYIAELCGLNVDLTLSSIRGDEEILKLYPFDDGLLRRNLKSDFVPPPGEHTFIYMTKGFVNAFIPETAAFCRKEISALRNGGQLTDPWEYAWTQK